MILKKLPITKLANMRLLVTGGSGFIGTALIEQYHRCGAVIMNLDIAAPMFASHQLYWRKQDILDAKGVTDAFRDFSPTHVVHLAARTDLDEEKDIGGYAANIEGVENVLRAVAQTKSVDRVLVASTVFVCEPGYTPKSDTDFRPHTLYGQSKVLTEKITRGADLHCAWAIIRPAMIWGPGHERLQHGFYRILKKGLYFHPGNTQAKKSYGYIGNAVFQIEKLLAADRDKINREVFNLTDPPVNLLQWTDEFSRQLLGRPVRRLPLSLMTVLAKVGDMAVKAGMRNFPMTSFRLGNMTTDSISNTANTDRLTGSLPYSMTDGVAETVSWIRNMSNAE